MTIKQIVSTAASLVGFGALISILVNIAKTVGWIKNDQATLWVVGGNLALILAVYVLQFFGQVDILTVLDAQVGTFAGILVMTSGFVLQVLSSKATHYALKGTPLVGKSFTLEAEKAKG